LAQRGKQAWAGRDVTVIFLSVSMTILAPRVVAKTVIDFDPNLNFSKFKTFA
jgi:hypothetical protein